MSSSKLLHLSRVSKEENICRAISLETTSYPADEAASASMIRFRQNHASAFFWAAYLQNTDQDSQTFVGFINGTLTAKEKLDEESMTQHDPHGSLLCIHSVVIDQVFRRQGLGAQMLKQYVNIICNSQPQVKRIMLISKAYLVRFYTSCGFTVKKLSSVVHGVDPWFELELDCEAAKLAGMVTQSRKYGEAS
ncbi:unnamed protein product [Peronospora belbahrii]|uniref:N-acetyltransferase domain-containing protein n=1 Tax=Peronospora belbahrii TaxID=622444 RepID=A0ABN8CPU9_9STRA|nr:unnamed protein product [Peronospora belbahrii]